MNGKKLKNVMIEHNLFGRRATQNMKLTGTVWKQRLP
jgi:hypothetical protein